MNQEQKILQKWISIKDEGGISKAKKTKIILLLLGVILSVVVAIIFYYKLNPLFSIIPSVLLGWSVAERNALTSRIKSWSKLEKYLNWDVIRENAKK